MWWVHCVLSEETYTAVELTLLRISILRTATLLTLLRIIVLNAAAVVFEHQHC